MHVELRDIKKLERDLLVFEKKVVPDAMKYALNTTAWKAREDFQGRIRSEFTNRNKFTERSIRVDAARGRNPSKMQSSVGSVADYMDEQEDGVAISGGGKHGKQVATDKARIGRSNSRVVSKPSKLQNITIAGRAGKGRSRRQKAAIAMRIAAKAGHKHVFLDDGDDTGIYRMMGGKRRRKLRRIWSMHKKTVTIKPTHMLRGVNDRAGAKLPQLQAKAIRFNMRKHRVLGF